MCVCFWEFLGGPKNCGGGGGVLNLLQTTPVGTPLLLAMVIIVCRVECNVRSVLCQCSTLRQEHSEWQSAQRTEELYVPQFKLQLIGLFIYFICLFIYYFIFCLCNEIKPSTRFIRCLSTIRHAYLNRPFSHIMVIV